MDFVDGVKPNVYGLSPNVVGSTLGMTLDENALDLSNIQKLLDGELSTGIAPRLLLLMDKIPAESASGTIVLSLKVLDGVDGTRDSGERELSSSVTANWVSDGTNIELTVPAQTQQVTFVPEDGIAVTATFANASPDIFTAKDEEGFGNYPGSLEVRALNFFKANTGDIELPALFTREGDYFLEVGIDQGGNDNMFYEGVPFNKLQATVKIEDVAIPEVMGFDVASSGFDEPSVVLVKPISASEVEEIELYPLLYGTNLEFDLGPHDALEAATLAGLVEGTTTLAPTLEFRLAHIPNARGSFKLAVTLTSGEDGERDEGVGERQVSATAEIDYDATGSSATMSLPAQEQLVTFAEDGLALSLTLTDVNNGTITVTPAGVQYPAELSVRLISIFNARVQGGLEASDLSQFFVPGDYHLKVEISESERESTDGVDVDKLLSYEGMPIISIEGIIPVN